MTTNRSLDARPVGDHEPLLADIRPLGRLSDRVLEQAADRYRQKFTIGQDSRTGDRANAVRADGFGR